MALVIGNGAYPSSPLENPANDARDFAAALRKLDFDVILRTDATLKEMDNAILDFGRNLEKKGGVGLFFYAGHGIQSFGKNYLIPVGAKLKRESSLKYEAVDVGKVLDEMGYAKNGLNIVILDACRDNPLARSFRSGARGLAKLDNTPTGTLLAYSTSPGRQAADGHGRNSPYTESLLKAIGKKGVPLELVFKDVIKDVKQQTRGQQIPWTSSSVDGDFYFIPPTTRSAAAKQQLAAAPSAGGQNSALSQNLWRFELLYWEGVMKNPTEAKFKAYLKDYPDGHFASIARSELKTLNADNKPSASRKVNVQSRINDYEAIQVPAITGTRPPSEEDIQTFNEYAEDVQDLLDDGQFEKANLYMIKMARLHPNGEKLQQLRARFHAAVQLDEEDQQIYDEYLEVVNDLLSTDQLNPKQIKKVNVYLSKLEKLNPYGHELGSLKLKLEQKLAQN